MQTLEKEGAWRGEQREAPLEAGTTCSSLFNFQKTKAFTASVGILVVFASSSGAPASGAQYGATFGVPSGWFAHAPNQTELVRPPVTLPFQTIATEPEPLDHSAMLNDARAAIDFTWDQMAKLFNVSRRAVHHWSSGGNMNSKNLEKLMLLDAAIAESRHMTPEQRKKEVLSPQALSGFSEMLGAFREDRLVLQPVVSVSQRMGLDVSER
ncbi:hypothetical protein [Sanguibacter inulinus]|uniref:Uncharacterized protein n=1 Tax=Sanguibacter inulinus TaxID=60922 RepID=A0A853ER83_9MICO|nr:hypothetical protein [Sanguibacter inulinus]MBF0721951.1 hypothetical protein [Sanguibacter inulinus]NYS93096.1 hypothetical protein [Sanguibacter inulinus]